MKSVIALARRLLVAWAFSSLAVAALIVATAVGWLSWRYGSSDAALAYLRGQQLALVPAVLDLGEGAPGERREAQLQIVNLTGRPAKLLGANSSCTCLIVPSDLSPEVPAGESRWIPLVLTFAGKQQEMEQSVTVYSDLGYTASASAVITGRITKAKGPMDGTKFDR